MHINVVTFSVNNMIQQTLYEYFTFSKGAVINYTRQGAGREIHGLRNQNLRI